MNLFLDPCGCPPVLDDDPKECQQLIFPESWETPCEPYSVLSQRTISNVVVHKLLRVIFLSSLVSLQFFGHQCL